MKNNVDKTEKWYKQLSDCVELVLHDNEMNFFKNSYHIRNKFTTCDNAGFQHDLQ